MSTFQSSSNGVEAARMDVPQLCDEFVARYPNLADAFRGEMEEGRDKFKRHPASITCFFELDRFKFVVSPRNSSRVAFGSGTNGLGGFSEIEEALHLGHFEWKLRGGQKRS